MTIFRTSRGRLSAFAIAVVPLLYTAAYLGAFWNPYGHLSRIPIALVNHDRGADGRILVTQLTKQFAVHVENSATAATALANGRIGMVVTIPAHYTFDLTHHHPARLEFRVDPGANYLTSILMQHEAQAVADGLAGTVRSQTLTAVGSGLSHLSSATRKVAVGASQVTHGLETGAAYDHSLSSSSQTLSLDRAKMARALEAWQGGAVQVAQHLGAFERGSAATLHGASVLSQAAMSIGRDDTSVSQAAAHLSSSSATLGGQAQELQGGWAQLSQATSRLGSAMQDNAALTHQIQALAVQESASPSSQTLGRMNTLLQQQSQLQSQLLQAASAITGSAHVLSQGTGALSGGIGQLSSGISQVGSASQSVASGARTWATQAKAWEQGVVTLNQGAATLSHHLSGLKNGAGVWSQQEAALGQGMAHWAQGSTQAATAFDTLAHRMGALSRGAGRIASEMPGLLRPVGTAVQPVSAHVAETDRANYGTGMAPYFLGLSLWVGAVVATVLVPGGRYRKNALRSRTWQSLAVSLLQAVLLGAGSVVMLPINPVHGWDYAFSILGVGLVWWAVVRLLVEKLGDAGRILGIVLLVVQLAASGGTYPVILSPPLFQVIHPYLPMTWAIHVLRWTLSNGYPKRAFGDAVRLAVLGLSAIALVRWWPAQWPFEAPVVKDGEADDAQHPLPHGIA